MFNLVSFFFMMNMNEKYNKKFFKTVFNKIPN